MSIPAYVLEQLNSQADLVSIIGKHTTLKKAGREFKGCCPFHGEKTPSFYVNPQKNVYNCFGCNVGGNAFTFLQEYENRTFMEAVTELSRQTGIAIPKDEREDVRYQRRKLNSPTEPQKQVQPPSPPNTKQNVSGHISHHNDYQSNPESAPPPESNPPYSDALPPASLEHFESEAPVGYEYASYDSSSYDSSSYGSTPSEMPYHEAPSAVNPTHTNLPFSQPEEGNLYDLLNSINSFYQQNLQQNPHALGYFKNRGLSDETIATFNLGYAPSGWQHLEAAFPQDIDGLKTLGLIRTSDNGRDYDLLRERVIFPIKDSRGRIIGFAGRALDNEVKPKYINSSDSPVFHKQQVLYGYYESRQHRANDWLVVEGYMDVIALYQAGIYGAVASMGTATNESQIARLLQFNPTLTLCFDGDLAGQKAAWRTLEISLPILDDGKELRFLSLPNKHDPDTFIEAYGVAAMQKQIQQALPLSQYVFAYLSDRYDLSLAEGKAKLMSQVRILTSQLPKGSSFRYILNNDIYQRLGGRRNQKIAAHDALLDFDSDMTISVQLELCLLFDPHMLNDDPIQALWQRSGVTAMSLPEKLSQSTVASDTQTPSDSNRVRYQLPNLPDWYAFEDSRLIDLVTTIKKLLPVIPKDINLSAHFILANLNNTRRQQLANRWMGFYQNLTQRGVIDVSELADDLLVHLLAQALTKQISSTNTGILVKQHISNQRTQLLNWYKEHQADHSTK